jgi:hypothetical protein
MNSFYPWYFLPVNPCCSSPCDPCGNPMSTPARQSDYIVYTGANLPCSGIDTGDTLTVVIQKIETLLCGITTTTTTTVIT